jgi:hypothetical protein
MTNKIIIGILIVVTFVYASVLYAGLHATDQKAQRAIDVNNAENVAIEAEHAAIANHQAVEEENIRRLCVAVKISCAPMNF